MSSFYRGPKDLAADNESYAQRRLGNEGSANDLYFSGTVSNVSADVIGQTSVFTPLPYISTQTTFTHANITSFGIDSSLTFTKVFAGIYSLDSGKSSISFLPNSFITFAGLSGDGATTPAVINGVFQTPTGFTLYPHNQYFLWFYLVTPNTVQDFFGTRGKSFTNNAGQIPLPVVDLSTRKAVALPYNNLPVVTFTSDRGFTFFKDA